MIGVVYLARYIFPYKIPIAVKECRIKKIIEKNMYESIMRELEIY